MKLVQIVFSPTGGTQRITEIITAGFGMSVEKVDLCSSQPSNTAIAAEDVALIAMPSFGGRVPALAAERLSQLKGNEAACVLVCVYGNRAYEDTLLEMQELAEANGFRVLAAVAAVAEHSIMHQFAAGRPDQQDAQELHTYAVKILDKIKAEGSEHASITLPGNRPYKKYGGVGLVPKAGKNCTGCGVCADACPAQAIDKSSLKTADAKKCISCMRCVAVCPHSARSANKAMVSAAALAMKKACSGRKDNELFL